jgi:hypothetical protein
MMSGSSAFSGAPPAYAPAPATTPPLITHALGAGNGKVNLRTSSVWLAPPIRVGVEEDRFYPMGPVHPGSDSGRVWAQRTMGPAVDADDVPE